MDKGKLELSHSQLDQKFGQRRQVTVVLFSDDRIGKRLNTQAVHIMDAEDGLPPAAARARQSVMDSGRRSVERRRKRRHTGADHVFAEGFVSKPPAICLDLDLRKAGLAGKSHDVHNVGAYADLPSGQHDFGFALAVGFKEFLFDLVCCLVTQDPLVGNNTKQTVVRALVTDFEIDPADDGGRFYEVLLR